MLRLSGKRVVVTGAGSGIGRAVVQRFLAEGARVMAVVRNAADVVGLEKDGAEVFVGDVSKYETAEGAVIAARERFNGLDCYVANAGLWDFHKRLEKQTPEELRTGFEEIFRVNLLGTLYGAHAAASALRHSRGSIIVTGSNAGFRAGGGGVLYTASKFALRGAVMQLAREFAPEVRVNGVAPGATDTGISGPIALGQETREMNADSGRMRATASHILLKRVSAPHEHTSLYVTLASQEETPYVTGTMFLSDGGLTISV